MMFIFVVYPVFKWLAKHDHVMVIAWIYVFTLIIVITFAIEIGQKVTNTGNMEFADIVFGVVGFIVMFFIFAVIREIYKGIVSLIRDVAHQDQNRSKRDIRERMTNMKKMSWMRMTKNNYGETSV